jgi:hypothetical protein
MTPAYPRNPEYQSREPVIEGKLGNHRRLPAFTVPAMPGPLHQTKFLAHLLRTGSLMSDGSGGTPT